MCKDKDQGGARCKANLVRHSERQRHSLAVEKGTLLVESHNPDIAPAPNAEDLAVLRQMVTARLVKPTKAALKAVDELFTAA